MVDVRTKLANPLNERRRKKESKQEPEFRIKLSMMLISFAMTSEYASQLMNAKCMHRLKGDVF